MTPYDRPTCPCETCGRPTPMLGTKRCDGCWEVESRLLDYIRQGGVPAVAFVYETLGKAGKAR